MPLPLSWLMRIYAAICCEFMRDFMRFLPDADFRR